ncbi:MAG: hypothetical protein J7L82_04520 [Staphylothermus sp.]|nr:hypothetical protein [Staphylothermus sp.]
MGFSSVVVEGIILVAAVIASAVVAATIVERVSVINDALRQSMKQQANSIMTRISIVYATYDTTVGLFVVYAKNIGKYPVIGLDKLNVYFGEYGKADLYVYDRDGVLVPGEWSYIEVSGSEPEVWEPGETIKIYIYNSTVVNSPFYVKIYTPSGSWTEEEFVFIPR